MKESTATALFAFFCGTEGGGNSELIISHSLKLISGSEKTFCSCAVPPQSCGAEVDHEVTRCHQGARASGGEGEAAEAKTRAAKAALKRAKKETAFAARAAIARALVSGVEEGWVTVDLDRLGVCARELMSEGDADAVEQITEVLREIESAREKAIAELTTEPEDEEDDELARILAGETSEEPTDPVEIDLATEKPPPRRPLGFRRPVVPHKP